MPIFCWMIYIYIYIYLIYCKITMFESYFVGGGGGWFQALKSRPILSII